MNDKRYFVRPALTPSIIDYEISSGLAHLDWLATEIEFLRSIGSWADVSMLIDQATEVAQHVYALIAELRAG